MVIQAFVLQTAECTALPEATVEIPTSSDGKCWCWTQRAWSSGGSRGRRDCTLESGKTATCMPGNKGSDWMVGLGLFGSEPLMTRPPRLPFFATLYPIPVNTAWPNIARWSKYGADIHS